MIWNNSGRTSWHSWLQYALLTIGQMFSVRFDLIGRIRQDIFPQDLYQNSDVLSICTLPSIYCYMIIMYIYIRNSNHILPFLPLSSPPNSRLPRHNCPIWQWENGWCWRLPFRYGGILEEIPEWYRFAISNRRNLRNKFESVDGDLSKHCNSGS